MPSVDVSWWGRCPEPARQRAICKRIGEIGKLADELLDQNGYRFWDCHLEGDIIAAADVFPPTVLNRSRRGSFASQAFASSAPSFALPTRATFILAKIAPVSCSRR